MSSGKTGKLSDETFRGTFAPVVLHLILAVSATRTKD
jgi:hypothetical protein